MMIAILALFLSVEPAGVQCSLPERVNAHLSRVLVGWRVADLEDLDEDDRGIWRARWGEACPFVSLGNVLSRTRKDYSAVLIQGKGDQRLQRVVVVRMTDPFLIVPVLPPCPAPRVSVIRSLPPGRYVGTDGEPIKVGLSPMMLETIEAGSLLFYWDRGAFRRLLLAE